MREHLGPTLSKENLRRVISRGLGLAALLGLLTPGPGCEPAIDEGLFTCDPNAPDPCPAGYACLRRGTSFEAHCYAEGDGYCGDGQWNPEHGEECDGQVLGALDCPDGTRLCSPNCEASCATCGNGVLERVGDQGEVCDGSDLGGRSCLTLGYDEGLLQCDAQCQLDTSNCRAFCGNGVVETSMGEECDGQNLGADEGESCASLGLGRLGQLGCDDDCLRKDTCQIYSGIALGYWSACGLGSLGRAYCWGRGTYGALGNGTYDSQDAPQGAPAPEKFIHLAAGTNHSCALTDDGSAWCWGDNTLGQLGTGDSVTKLRPTKVNTSLRFSMLALGVYHSCGIEQDGAIYCWGGNNSCQLGTGNEDGKLTPYRVAGALSFVSLSAGGFHTCAVDTAFQAHCWGSGDCGQLGAGDNLRRCEPSAVLGGIAFVSISAGMMHTCAVDTASGAHCWGDNSSGQLGNGTFGSTVLLPSPVPGLSSISQIAASEFHSCALEETGRAFCWGGNYSGKLGNGTTQDSASPTEVHGSHSFGSLSLGGAFTCGVDLGGAAWCWGDNFFGQLGAGLPASSATTPVLVAPSTSDGPEQGP
ncbi:MAG: hypothetical protein RBU30_19400 [Polyangia bacterium]|jgi:alpha-tubulin suppressor-like RCC1 family protein|nr:hypothetical protein [Polyangia bacterium]